MSWSIVQSASTSTGTYPISVTLGTNVTIGNTIIILALHTYAGCPVSVTDGLGNTYSFLPASQVRAGTLGAFLEVFAAPVTTGGACTVQLSAACGSGNAIYALEISGLTASPYDGSSPTEDTSSPFTTPSITTVGNGDLILGYFCTFSGGSPTFTVGGGATQVGTTTFSMLQSQTQASAGAITATATGTGASFASGVAVSIIALKATGGGSSLIAPNISGLIWPMRNRTPNPGQGPIFPRPRVTNR